MEGLDLEKPNALMGPEGTSQACDRGGCGAGGGCGITSAICPRQTSLAFGAIQLLTGPAVFQLLRYRANKHLHGLVELTPKRKRKEGRARFAN